MLQFTGRRAQRSFFTAAGVGAAWKGAAAKLFGAMAAGVAFASFEQPVHAAGEAPEGSINRGTVPDGAHKGMPIELGVMTHAPECPPPITRNYPVFLRCDMTFDNVIAPLTRKDKYEFWGINGRCPGPMIRCREGDVVEINLHNRDTSGMPHNIDFHAFDGPGGGAPLLLCNEGKSRTAQFKVLHSGVYIYHCAAAPIPLHLANGMYGLIVVEPKEGLPRVDREFYIMQSEFYLDYANMDKASGIVPCDYAKGLREDADAVVFNGREGSMTEKGALKANVNETIRMYVGNGGPNLISSFHVIGTIFEKVYREGDLVSPPARNVQTTLIPPGGSTCVEFTTLVPGNLTLVDHALFRLDKGCVGFLMVSGPERPDVYYSKSEPTPCYGCKTHP